MIFSGKDIKGACEKGVAMFPLEIGVGIIAVSKTGYAIAANTEMAHHAMVKEK